MKTREQLLKEAHILKKELSEIEGQLSTVEIRRMQKIAGILNEDVEYNEGFKVDKTDPNRVVGRITTVPQLKTKLLDLAKEVTFLQKDKTYKADGPELAQLGMLLDNIMNIIGKPESIVSALKKANQAFMASKIDLTKKDI
jgi:hypothetical protein